MIRPQNRRRNILINPRFQGGIAVVLAAIILVGGTFFAWLVYSDTKQALWNASMQGHFRIGSPYEIVGGSLVRHLLGLFAAVFAASVVAFLLVLRMIRKGIGAIVASLKASAGGDLSTPTAARGMDEIMTFSQHLDEVRQAALLKLGEIRDEAVGLARDIPAQELFRARWDALKRKIGGIAP